MAREFELIIWGATGFTGQLVAEYLWQTVGNSVNWAIAGRDQNRLQAVADKINAPRLPTLIAALDDEQSLQQLAAKTQVLCSTVGPYSLYGEPMVAACAGQGTHYCDLSGEVLWVRKMIERYQAQAMKQGACLVPCSGFDSIPSDLGVWTLQQQALQSTGQLCQQITMGVKWLKGGISGGTMASMEAIMAQVRRDPQARKQLSNRYALLPDQQQVTNHIDLSTGFDSHWQRWYGPFLMASINQAVVQRSHGLAHDATPLVYQEHQLTGKGWRGRAKAEAMRLGLGLMTLGRQGYTPWAWFNRRWMPEPGQGPSPQQQQEGGFELWFRGQVDEQTITAKAKGKRDPGYGATSRMLGQSALLLVEHSQQVPAGFRTPATTKPEALIQRLKTGDITFSAELS